MQTNIHIPNPQQMDMAHHGTVDTLLTGPGIADNPY